MKNLLIILIVLFATVGCGNQKTLESNSTVTKVFNDSEIHNLTLILEFFNKQICSLENTKGSDINDCYNKFIQRMTESAETGNMEINIPFKEQIKLYNAIDEQTFNEIWQMGWQRTPRLSIDTLTYIDLKNIDNLDDDHHVSIGPLIRSWCSIPSRKLLFVVLS